MFAASYGIWSETWTLTKQAQNKLAAAQTKMERSMLNITYKDRRTNIWIRERTKVIDIINTVRKMKWSWAGHITRLKYDRWTSRVTTLIPYDKKRRQGRPPKRWRDDLDKYWSDTIWQRTAQDRVIYHDAKLEAVPRRTREREIKQNPDKCVFRANQVTYFGNIWSADGLRPDPVMTQGIRDLPLPTSRAELETVLGMATYLGKFASNLSDVTAPLRDLTKKENDFIWDAVGGQAYNSMKQLLCKDPGPVLAYFDSQKYVVLHCDASQKGLGATLLQERHPIFIYSKVYDEC